MHDVNLVVRKKAELGCPAQHVLPYIHALECQANLQGTANYSQTAHFALLPVTSLAHLGQSTRMMAAPGLVQSRHGDQSYHMGYCPYYEAGASDQHACDQHARSP